LAFGERLAKAPARWIEPPGPSQSAAGLFGSPNAIVTLGASFVRKAIYSREGADALQDLPCRTSP
jgi:hypothetical protein